MSALFTTSQMQIDKHKMQNGSSQVAWFYSFQTLNWFFNSLDHKSTEILLCVCVCVSNSFLSIRLVLLLLLGSPLNVSNLFVHCRKRAGTVVSMSVNVSCLLSVLLQPYMPSVSGTIQQQLNAPADVNTITPTFICRLPAGHKIGKVNVCYVWLFF